MDANRNRRTGWIAAGVVAGMVGLTYASVPLYNLFCRVTGYGGTPKVASQPAPGAVEGRMVTVRFNADVDRDMPWRFHPDQSQIQVRVGEETLISYTAENLSSKPVTGNATFNVLPEKAAVYFSKIQCFCFEEQTLEPGQKVHMPVSFFVDPALLDDPNTRSVQTITLSYTFFKSPNQPVRVSTAPAKAKD